MWGGEGGEIEGLFEFFLYPMLYYASRQEIKPNGHVSELKMVVVKVVHTMHFWTRIQFMGYLVHFEACV